MVPGDQKILGNDMAQAAAQSGRRKTPQSPSQHAFNCEEPAEQLQEEVTPWYDPIEELRTNAARIERLTKKWESEDSPLSTKAFKRRKGAVQLRGIPIGGAVMSRVKNHVNLSQLRRSQPYAVPPDPRCQKCKNLNAIPRLDHLL